MPLCKQCQKDFPIEPDDLTFYAKIDVPPPTWCPSCRMQRRMLFFNERALYKRTCKLCNKEIITSHQPDAQHPVYCQPCWWSDKWDPMDYGRDYDPNRSFFEQFNDLMKTVPLPALNNIYSSNVESEYCNMTSYIKRCYLLFNSDYDEECAFSCYLEKSQRCYDVDHGIEVQLCYDTIGTYKSYRVMYSSGVLESMDIWFSYELRNCRDCFACCNLRGKQYCIFNEQKTKNEYFQEIKKYDLTSYDTVQALKKKSWEFFVSQPHKYLAGVGNINVTADYSGWSKNVQKSYQIIGSEDCKYCQFFIIGGSKNCMDVTMWGSNLTYAYECLGVGNNQSEMLCVYESWNEASRLSYCREIYANTHDLFGCVALRNKQYCILNKQYSKEEYEKLYVTIRAKMISDGEWGEFFPPRMSSYSYNESFANKYVPLTKEEALSKGFRWSDSKQRNYKVGGDVIACEHNEQCNQQCTGAFKLISNEKEFYKNMGIPTPRLCPNCRHYERLKLRNPTTLWHRKCMNQGCQNEFETSYAPDRPEVIYCEQCYNAEIV